MTDGPNFVMYCIQKNEIGTVQYLDLRLLNEYCMKFVRMQFLRNVFKSDAVCGALSCQGDLRALMG